jgi:protein-tyrosine phosphatase
MRRRASEAGFAVEVDSAGTGDWHVGSPPDRRAVAVARRHGIDISAMRARQVAPTDFARFDHIIALDRDNLFALETLQPPGSRASLSLLLDHVEGREGEPVLDPYYGGDEHFDQAWADVWEGTGALVRKLMGLA